MPNVGFYGKPAPHGMLYDPATVDKWCYEYPYSLMTWAWLQPPYPAGNPTYADQMKAAGKKILVQGLFGGADGIPSAASGTYWDVMYDNPSLYDVAVSAILSEVDNFGQENIYGVTISEEEPGLGYAWGPHNWTHFSHGWNAIYDGLKAARPDLKVFGNFNLNRLSNAELDFLKFDAMEAHRYDPQPLVNREHWDKGWAACQRKGIGPEDFFIIIFAATTPYNWYQPSGDPALIRPNFEEALNAGYQNIGFYWARPGGTGTYGEERIGWSDYPDIAYECDKNNPYLHKQEILALIEEYAVPPVEYTLTIEILGQGTTIPAPDISHPYPEGELVLVTAIPDAGWQFIHWQGDISTTANPVSFQMLKDMAISAVFEEVPVPPEEAVVTITALGQGTTNPEPGAHIILIGELLTITAIPQPGYQFDHWQGDITGIENPKTIEVTGNLSIVAVFVTEIPPAPSLRWMWGPVAIVTLVIGAVLVQRRRKR